MQGHTKGVSTFWIPAYPLPQVEAEVYMMEVRDSACTAVLTLLERCTWSGGAKAT